MERNKSLEAQRTKLLEAQAAELKAVRTRMQIEKEKEVQALIQQYDAEQRSRQQKVRPLFLAASSSMSTMHN